MTPERMGGLRCMVAGHKEAGYETDALVLEECLDEIDRLQGENHDLKILVETTLDTKNVEISRLRSALEKIALGGDVVELENIASEALEGK